MTQRPIEHLRNNDEHPAVDYYTCLKMLLAIHQNEPDDRLPESPHTGVDEYGRLPEWTDQLTQACEIAEYAAIEAIEERLEITQSTGLPPSNSGLPNTTRTKSFEITDPKTGESEEFAIPPEAIMQAKMGREQVERVHVEQRRRDVATAIADSYGPKRNHRVEKVEGTINAKTDGGETPPSPPASAAAQAKPAMPDPQASPPIPNNPRMPNTRHSLVPLDGTSGEEVDRDENLNVERNVKPEEARELEALNRLRDTL